MARLLLNKEKKRFISVMNDYMNLKYKFQDIVRDIDDNERIKSNLYNEIDICERIFDEELEDKIYEYVNYN